MPIVYKSAEMKAAIRANKKAESKIADIYQKNCSGITIDIMDIGKVFKVGKDSIAAGDSDEVLTQRIILFVNSISRAA